MQAKIRNFSANIVIILALFMPFVAMGEESLTLKDVMKGLNTNLQEASYGIIMEDYDLVAKSAQAIAEHPTPAPEVLKKVADHLGAEMPKFKGFDLQVHDTALKLKAAAIEHDKEELINQHSAIVRGCVGCHQSYRNAISKLLSN